MAKLKWLSASIVVDGEDLPEIPDEEFQSQRQKAKAAQCYVEAAEGCDFLIKVGVPEGYPLGTADGLAYDIFLDGEEKDDCILFGDTKLSHGAYEYEHKGAMIEKRGKWMLHKFRFSKLQIGEIALGDDEALPLLDDLGTIKVEFWRYRHRKSPRQRARKGVPIENARNRSRETEARFESARDSDEDPPLVQTVPEKALKGQAINIKTDLGEPEDCQQPEFPDGYRPDKTPVGVFIFKYRTKQALKEMHLIPRTPTPIPLEERAYETLTEAEKMELFMRYKNEAAAAKTRIKQERQERNLQALRPIKRSSSDAGSDDEIEAVGTRAVKRRAPEPNEEVIELSD